MSMSMGYGGARRGVVELEKGRNRNPYVSQGYRGLGGEISTLGYVKQGNGNGDLGILSAERYVDGERGSGDVMPVMAFGVTEVEMESDGKEREVGRGKRRRVQEEEVDEDEEARKKARGRPRVDTKDETAADRRRTQIRMAQRAYRNRKETTITTLEKQVQDLRGSNEEMSNIFITLYDFAVNKGLLQREPEFGQQLQSTTERLLAIARASQTDDGSHEETEDHEKEFAIAPARKNKAIRAVTKKRQQEPEPAPLQIEEQPVSSWGGYIMCKEDTPVEEIPPNYNHDSYFPRNDVQVITRPTEENASFPEFDFNQNTYMPRDDLQIITRPTQDNASFPFDLYDLQNFRVEVPPMESFASSFLPFSQPALPATHSYTEFSFARRLQRCTAERAYALMLSPSPVAQKIWREKFAFTLMYETAEQIMARMEMIVSKSSTDPLSKWCAPYVHIGGAGTYYPAPDTDMNSGLMPKFRTGLSMGPFSTGMTEAGEYIQDGMQCTLDGFEGEFFDSNDVEGYLHGRGVDIPPTADFVTVELDLSELSTTKSRSSGSSASDDSPKTPEVVADAFTYDLGFSKPEGLSFPFPSVSDWKDEATVKANNYRDPLLGAILQQKLEQPVVRASDNATQKRLVTVDVNALLTNLINGAVCLGRGPGFRPAMVNAAILSSTKTEYP